MLLCLQKERRRSNRSTVEVEDEDRCELFWFAFFEFPLIQWLFDAVDRNLFQKKHLCVCMCVYNNQYREIHQECVNVCNTTRKTSWTE